jgi:hypothetical protein
LEFPSANFERKIQRMGRGSRRREKITKANRRLENYRQWKEGKKSLSWMGTRWKTVYDRDREIGSLPPNLQKKT